MVCLPFSLVSAVLVSTAKTIPTSTLLDTPNYQRLAWYVWAGCISTPSSTQSFHCLQSALPPAWQFLGEAGLTFFFQPLNTERVSPWPNSSQDLRTLHLSLTVGTDFIAHWKLWLWLVPSTVKEHHTTYTTHHYPAKRPNFKIWNRSLSSACWFWSTVKSENVQTRAWDCRSAVEQISI